MRDILFAGKRIDNGEWIESKSITQEGDEIFLYEDCGDHYLGHKVIPETVGQYIGMSDKSGKKIFEGYIVKFTHGAYPVMVGAVGYEEQELGFTLPTKQTFNAFGYMEDCYEIIGNIHDNPELLEVQNGR